MEGCASREYLGFLIALLISTRIHNLLKKLAMTALKFICTPSLITVDIFSLVIPLFFAFYLICL